MLPSERRMRRSDEFGRTVRRGKRSGSRSLVVHLAAPDEHTVVPATPARVGFVVGKSVGGSVVRSTVSRRLRHVMRARLDRLPPGALVVVRALGASRYATSTTLADEIDRALDRLLPSPATLNGGSV